MNYDEALSYIYDFANLEKHMIRRPDDAELGLDRIRELTAYFGSPQESLKTVLIAGTKGKGSTAAMAESILRRAGYHTGLYTQPHLHTYRERFRVDGIPISKERFAGLVERVKQVIEEKKMTQVTTYEIATAIMFQYFQEKKVDIAILEVGLGGRLDSTNIVNPLVSVITSISMDHMQILGNTIEKIAAEKAGIIKSNGVALVAPQNPEALEMIEAKARQQEARVVLVGRDVTYAGLSQKDPRGGQGLRVFFQPNFVPDAITPADIDLWIPLEGKHQLVNATMAVALVTLLSRQGFKATDEDIREGLAAVEWLGRLEPVSEHPRIVIDGAHNADSAEKLALALKDDLGYRNLYLVIGTSGDKDIPGILQALVPGAAMTIVTRSSHPRAADPDFLATEARKYSEDVRIAATPRDAIEEAKKLAGEEDLICITGSLFMVAEARVIFGLARDVDSVQL